MKPVIRVIYDKERTPAFNMAADSYLMNKAAEEKIVYIRFYTWSPPAVSLGCMQDPETQLNLAELASHGISWVKRQTGGRAVLHKGDLTYSFIFSKEFSFLGRTVAETYLIVAKCLLNGLKICGIEAQLEVAVSPLVKAKEVKIPCFLATNRSEIMVEGKKLIGSAQYRNATAVLQHGSIPMTDEYLLLPYFLPISKEEKDKQIKFLKEKTIYIKKIVPDIDIDILIEKIKYGFTDTLDLNFTEKNWKEDEIDEIMELVNLK